MRGLQTPPSCAFDICPVKCKMHILLIYLYKQRKVLLESEMVQSPVTGTKDQLFHLSGSFFGFTPQCHSLLISCQLNWCQCIISLSLSLFPVLGIYFLSGLLMPAHSSAHKSLSLSLSLRAMRGQLLCCVCIRAAEHSPAAQLSSAAVHRRSPSVCVCVCVRTSVWMSVIEGEAVGAESGECER